MGPSQTRLGSSAVRVPGLHFAASLLNRDIYAPPPMKTYSSCRRCCTVCAAGQGHMLAVTGYAQQAHLGYEERRLHYVTTSAAAIGLDYS
jgi:hypothetical protein